MLEVKNVSKTFTSGLIRKKKIQAVKNVSFSLESGRTLGIMGNSGCGKTTLSRIILHLIEPDEGQIFINEKRVSGFGKKMEKKDHRKVQMVFQHPGSALDPSKKIQYSLMEPMEIQKLFSEEERRERIEKLLKLTGISPNLLKRYPHEISGGEAQRLVICRSLVLEPQTLILDEPTSMLDVSVQASILNLLKELQKELDLSYLFISHDLDVLSWFSDDIAVMKQGEFLEIGKKDSVLLRPQKEYTKQLIQAFSH